MRRTCSEARWQGSLFPNSSREREGRTISAPAVTAARAYHYRATLDSRNLPVPGARREGPESAQPSPSPRDPRRSAIHTRSCHSTYAGRTVGYGQTEKEPASLHLAADEPRTAEMHTDLVPSAGECQQSTPSIVAIRRSPILAEWDAKMAELGAENHATSGLRVWWRRS